MFTHLRRLLEMIRFSHTLFALPFALLSALMAWHLNQQSDPPIPFSWRELAGILVCMVFARSASMAFNRLADRHLDAENPRTQTRHLPTGSLSRATVVVFTVICSLGFVGGTLFFTPGNYLPLYASVPVLFFLFGYSFAKRFTLLAHFWLGGALMLAPLAAWVAIRPEIAVAPILLGAAVCFWVAGFDIIYACQDYEFDVAKRLHSIPAKFGIRRALRIAAACHGVMLVLLFLLPTFFPPFGKIIYGGLIAIAVLLVYEHSLVKENDLTRVNQAFFHVNAVVSIGLLVLGAVALWW